MVLLWMLFGYAGFRVAAVEVPDISRAGSIRITMRYMGETIPGGTMTIHRAGNIREDDGNYEFVPEGDFTGSGIEFGNTYTGELALKLAQYAADKGLSGRTLKIDESGRVVLDSLSPGLYLFMQSQAAEGYEKVNPFLVSIPQLVDGAYLYDVDASPKIGVIKEQTEPPSTKPADPTLPQTGQLNWPVAVMASFGLAFLTVGAALRKKK